MRYLIIIMLLALMLAPISLPHFFPYMDKVGHFLVYAIITFMLSRVLTIRKAVFISVVVGAGVEFSQLFIASRDFEALDVAANTFGAVSCWFLSTQKRMQLWFTKFSI